MREYSDVLLMFQLKALRPEVSGAGEGPWGAGLDRPHATERRAARPDLAGEHPFSVLASALEHEARAQFMDLLPSFCRRLGSPMSRSCVIPARTSNTRIRPPR